MTVLANLLHCILLYPKLPFSFPKLFPHLPLFFTSSFLEGHQTLLAAFLWPFKISLTFSSRSFQLFSPLLWSQSDTFLVVLWQFFYSYYKNISQVIWQPNELPQNLVAWINPPYGPESGFQAGSMWKGSCLLHPASAGLLQAQSPDH